MHLCRFAKIITVLFVGIFVLPAKAQLNSPSEIIETIEDIQIQEDTQKKNSKPRFDEEFQREKITEEEPLRKEDIEKMQEQELKALEEPAPIRELEPQEEINSEEEFVERKIVPEEKNEKKDFDQTLKENAEEVAPEMEKAQENRESFEIEEGVVGNPEESSPLEEDLLSPEEDLQVTAPLEEEKSNQDVDRSEKKDEFVRDEETQEKIEFERVKEEEFVTVPIVTKPQLTEKEIEALEKKTRVEIEKEPYYQSISEMKGRGILKSYKDRRPSWTHEVGLEYNSYEPTNYISTLNPAAVFTFDEYYEFADTPLIQGSYDFKKNFKPFSVGLGLSLGYYSASNEEAELKLLFASIRGLLYLDTLFSEPYVVPYLTGGYSYIEYNEEFDDGLNPADEIKDRTDLFYIGAGAKFQLDWLDPYADKESYEMGIENTFVFVEARTYLDTTINGTEEDPDFSSDVYVSSGIRIEY